jgi:hypothetical protein
MELEMPIFYRGPCVLITHKVFETRCPVHRSYFLDELYQVCVVKWTVDPSAVIGSVRIGSSSVAGATAIALALSQVDNWQALASPLATAAMAVLLIVSVAVSGACWRVNAVEHELAAVYRGQPVSLYRSPDLREFGQVKRALVRALEQLSDTR